MGEIVWTDEARSWLREIYDYIAADNATAAARVVEGILRQVERLRQFPEAGARIEMDDAAGLRQLLYGHYRVVYRIGEDRIEIIGVFHGAPTSLDGSLTTNRPGAAPFTTRSPRACPACFDL